MSASTLPLLLGIISALVMKKKGKFVVIVESSKLVAGMLGAGNLSGKTGMV